MQNLRNLNDVIENGTKTTPQDVMCLVLVYVTISMR